MKSTRIQKKKKTKEQKKGQKAVGDRTGPGQKQPAAQLILHQNGTGLLPLSR
jgi:hypothetical protein